MRSTLGGIVVGSTVRVQALGLLIAASLTACDNIQWGGADVVVVPPPPHVSDLTESDSVPGAERLPEGPILYHVRPTPGGYAELTPIAEVAGDTLLPLRAASDWQAFGERFVAEHLREGAEFTLFRNGARAGTFVVQSTVMPDAGSCPPVPRATGILELTAAGATQPEFLAMARGHAPAAGYEPPVAMAPDQRARVLAPILAERVIRARGAMLPNDWQRATAQIHPFPVGDGGEVGFAATFLVGDTLGPGADDQGQSTFFVALPAATGYDTAYVRFTDYPASGKAAPRVVDFFDWNRDGRAGLVLQVYGTNGAWYEAVAEVGGEWRRVFDGRCTPAAPATGAPAQDAGGAPPPAADPPPADQASTSGAPPQADPSAGADPEG